MDMSKCSRKWCPNSVQRFSVNTLLVVSFITFLVVLYMCHTDVFLIRSVFWLQSSELSHQRYKTFRILEGRTPEQMNYILREYNCNFGLEMCTCNVIQYIFAFQMLLWWVAETFSPGEPAVFFWRCVYFFHIALTSVWKLSQAAARVQTVFLLLTQEDRLWSHLAAGALPSSSRSTLSSSNIRAGTFRTFWVLDPSRFHERSLKCNNFLWKYMGKCFFNMYF